MAGDWIPVEVTIHAKPKVVRLARDSGKSVDEVVGLLVRFWSWAQAHTEDGDLAGLDADAMSAASQVPVRFLGCLETVGWLCRTEEGYQIPDFAQWHSGAAKRRMQTRQRVRRHRQSTGRDPPGDCNASVTHERYKSVTREEKRTEENKKPPSEVCGEPPPPLCRDGPPSEFTFPCRGKGPAQWTLPAAKLQEYVEAFPGLDVEAELRKARQWARDNPLKRKTASGMLSFLTRWLGNAANGNGRNAPASSTYVNVSYDLEGDH